MLFPWKPALNDLITLLAGLYPKRNRARFIVRRMSLDPIFINFGGAPIDFWTRIVEEANNHDKVPDLIEVAKKDFPNINFDALEQQLSQPMVPAVPKLS